MAPNKAATPTSRRNQLQYQAAENASFGRAANMPARNSTPPASKQSVRPVTARAFLVPILPLPAPCVSLTLQGACSPPTPDPAALHPYRIRGQNGGFWRLGYAGAIL